MGCTTIMITHHMEHALRIGNRLLLMSRGRIFTDLPEERKNDMTTQDLIDLIGTPAMPSATVACSQKSRRR
jgi:putative tryptophan/tyrosine transport system ATP-binding protein